LISSAVALALGKRTNVSAVSHPALLIINEKSGYDHSPADEYPSGEEKT
jgi:hypothetical protein